MDFLITKYAESMSNPLEIPGAAVLQSANVVSAESKKFYSGKTAALHAIIPPCREIHYWAGYERYPTIQICEDCAPKDESKESRQEYAKKLIEAIKKIEGIP